MEADREQAAARRAARAAMDLKWVLPDILVSGENITAVTAWGLNLRKAPRFRDWRAESRGRCPEEMTLRQVKHLNNVVEADRGKLKQLIRPAWGF